MVSDRPNESEIALGLSDDMLMECGTPESPAAPSLPISLAMVNVATKANSFFPEKLALLPILEKIIFWVIWTRRIQFLMSKRAENGLFTYFSLLENSGVKARILALSDQGIRYFSTSPSIYHNIPDERGEFCSVYQLVSLHDVDDLRKFEYDVTF